MHLFFKKQFLFLYGLVFFVAVGFLILAFFLLRSTNPASQPPSTPSSNPNGSSVSVTQSPDDPYSPAYKNSVKAIHQDEKSQVDQDKKVAAFINTLPVVGINFTAKYDIATNSVIVTIPTDKKTEGNQEFTTYLKKSGVEDQSWIQNLSVRYRDSEPGVQ